MFLNRFMKHTPCLPFYILTARHWKKYDFKVKGIKKGQLSDDELTKYIYRGMPIKLDNTTSIFSGRDVGNFAAGYISGKKGLSWQETRCGFDLYQKIKNPANPIEGMTSQLAQIQGYKYIENTSHARIMRYWIEMMSVINSSQ